MDKESKMLKGAVTIMWGHAWANHVEESYCRKLSGCKIEDEMPETPLNAWILAAFMLGQVLQANHTSEIGLIDMARRADGEIEPGKPEMAPSSVLTMAKARYGAGLRSEEDPNKPLWDWYDRDAERRTRYCAKFEERLGMCLAWMAMRSGISWFDDHEEFSLVVPSVEDKEFELQIEAEATCEDCDDESRARCERARNS